MPKPSKGKKRKVRIKSDQRKKNAKRPKLDEESTHQNVDCETVKPESNEAEEDNEEEEQGLEKMLEEHAVRNNLSAINVKSILHHVITDKRVLDLVQKVIAEKEKEQSEETDDFSIEYEPKMTRSKYKQTNMNGDPIAQLTKSPLKSQKPVSTFTDLEFPESSSDEEYAPDEDEEDEDTESYLSHQSDLASPFKPATPDTVSMDSFQDTNSADTTSLSVSRPLTRHRSQEVLFRKPETVSASTPDKNDLIAKRTRSLLPLRDKDLAYGMDSELPDFMPDLYDQLKLDDLDDDQLAFQIFLQSLANGDDDYIVAEDDDYEYDFMAENHIEEKEEYRNDRAVRITKKEVSDLFAELLQECNENEDDDILWSARSLLLDFEESDEVLFTDEQRAQLSKQMNQHVQLLTQVYLLSREQPTLQDEADVCRQYLNELQGFCDRSLSVHPIMALGGNMPVLSMFDVPGIKEAIRIVDEPFNAVKRPRSPRKQAIDSKAKTARIALPTVSLTNQTRMANSLLFREVILLPRYGFMDKDLIGVKELSSLRVKFTETEDYLLALGMKQFQRNWKVIQTHLLPVKTPKQLQIRCKNLYSSRAQDNIIKHLRDTKTLGKLPTDIIIYCDSESSRRFSPIPEPEWLISYRQKVKPQRKLLPPNPQCQTLTVKSRTQYPIIVSSSSRLGAYEVVCKSEEQDKQGGSNHASANVEKQAGELIPSNESEQRKHASIEASSLGYQQRDALPNYGETLPNNSEHSQIQTAKTLEESGDTSNHRAPNEQDEESDDQPLVNSPCISSVTDKSVSDNLKENINTSSPEVIHSKNTDLDNDDNQPSPGNDGDGCYDDMDTEHPIEIDDNAPCTPTVLEDRQDLIQGSPGLSSPGPSESTVEKNSKSSPIAVTTKSKTVRDKSASAATLSNSSCNAKKSNPSLTTLPPDPKEHIRAQALADSYLDRVKKALQNDQVHYEEFLCTLVESSACLWTPVQLYRRMEIVLSEYPELIEDFVAFLEPEQALEAGVLMESLEFIRARSFLRRLEVHFHKHRSHFQKIIEAFSTWNSGNKTPLELHEKVVPLLRGQQHLVDEFQSFFDNLKPSICSEEDFEEVEIGSGSDPEVDDFEEVVIPDMIEPRKTKAKLKVRQTPASAATRTTSSTKQKLTPKPIGVSRTRNTKSDRRRNLSKKSPQAVDSVSRDDVSGLSEGEDEISSKKLSDGSNDSIPEKISQEITTDRSECDELFSEQNPSSIRTEGSASDCPLSVASSFHNDTSNDSVRQDDQDEQPKPRWSRIASNDVIDDISNDITENDDNEESDNYDDSDDIQDESPHRTLSAQNHHLGHDGQLVVLWTRDDDRIILSTCHHQGATSETFDELSTKLKGKTANEIKRRFEELMKLYEADNAKEGSSSEEEDEDDDSEGSEPETDS